jgi:hypothetical protein
MPPRLQLMSPSRDGTTPHVSSRNNTEKRPCTTSYTFAFSFASSFSCMRCRAASCFNAALTFLCRFFRPFPRFGPSIEIGSARRCFRAACFSARTFSRFLSRFRNVLIEVLSRVPYAPRNLSNCLDDTYIMKCSSSNLHEIHQNTHMGGEFCILSVRYPDDTGIFPEFIRRIHRYRIHRYIITIMGYCRSG